MWRASPLALTSRKAWRTESFCASEFTRLWTRFCLACWATWGSAASHEQTQVQWFPVSLFAMVLLKREMKYVFCSVSPSQTDQQTSARLSEKDQPLSNELASSELVDRMGVCCTHFGCGKVTLIAWWQCHFVPYSNTSFTDTRDNITLGYRHAFIHGYMVLYSFSSG